MDDPLGLNAIHTHPAWALPTLEPTSLIALWPGATAPDVAALADRLAPRSVAPLEHDDPAQPAAVVVELEELPAPMLLWSEPAQPLAPGELDDPAAARCRFVVGVETLLDPDDPLVTFATLVRRMIDLAPDTPAILDVNCTSWHPRDAIQHAFIDAPVEPPVDVLWIIQAVAPARARAGGVWLHTHGLWRCGRPELELVDVPPAHANAAAGLLNDVAALWLESDLPAPDAPFEIGPDLAVVVRPWSEVAGALPAGAPGGIADREGGDDGAHGGVRGIVCAAAPDRSGAWRWPEELVAARQRGAAAIFRSVRTTRRQATLARHHWPALVDLAENERAKILVKAGFAPERESATRDREHLWFAMREIGAASARGELLDDSATTNLTRGAVYPIDVSTVSDWIVEFDGRGYGPEQLEPLRAQVAS
jgi:hypothetical protein